MASFPTTKKAIHYIDNPPPPPPPPPDWYGKIAQYDEPHSWECMKSENCVSMNDDNDSAKERSCCSQQNLKTVIGWGRGMMMRETERFMFVFGNIMANCGGPVLYILCGQIPWGIPIPTK